ncbi:hypothetical protein PG996_005819 [Apiospora saccharicola]|uniref:Uncharacterized protein n=1 Tax=Apiospora saccharicola TaxID=335842 RepID=A0ABR1VQ89_9PEZI
MITKHFTAYKNLNIRGKKFPERATGTGSAARMQSSCPLEINYKFMGCTFLVPLHCLASSLVTRTVLQKLSPGCMQGPSPRDRRGRFPLEGIQNLGQEHSGTEIWWQTRRANVPH